MHWGYNQLMEIHLYHLDNTKTFEMMKFRITITIIENDEFKLKRYMKGLKKIPLILKQKVMQY